LSNSSEVPAIVPRRPAIVLAEPNTHYLSWHGKLLDFEIAEKACGIYRSGL
jgi:hypothetical protein